MVTLFRFFSYKDGRGTSKYSSAQNTYM